MDFEAIAAGLAGLGNQRRAIETALRAAYVAGREAMKEDAAMVADEKAASVIIANTSRGRVNSAASFAAGLLEGVAAAIRALPGKEGVNGVLL